VCRPFSTFFSPKVTDTDSERIGDVLGPLF
jgi:hypothetical protein